MDAGKMNRIRGVFYGQLIGDALGSRYEFKSAQQVSQMVMQDRNKETGFLPLLGGGPFGMRPGQVTDDSEMALALVESLIQNKDFVPSDVAKNYVRWYESSPPDIGITTASALVGNKALLTEGRYDELVDRVVNQVQRQNSQSLSNGFLMRSSPLAIAFHGDEARLTTAAEMDTQLTHSHQTALDASKIYLLAIAGLINGSSPQQVYENALNHQVTRNNPLILTLLADAKERPIPVKLPDGSTTDGASSKIGYFGVAFQGAFYELLHAPSFSKGLEDIVQRGGDTDTNGCIGTAMLGGRFGAENIPQEWIDAVRSAKPRDPSLQFLDMSNCEKNILALSVLSNHHL